VLNDNLMKKRQLGVTLVELMITVAIVGILISIVTPNIRPTFTKSSITADINDLNSLFQHARFTAVDQQSTVVICPSADFSTCSTSWTDSKIAFIDANNNDTLDANETLLSSTEALASNRMASNRNIIRFLDSGASSFDANTNAMAQSAIVICPDNNDSNFAKGLYVTPQGRIRLSQDSNDDGRDEDISGTNLSC